VAKAVRHGDQDVVPDQVAVGVVDRLESVEVAEQHGHRLGVTVAARQDPGGVVVPCRGVEQTGLGVGAGSASQLADEGAAPQNGDQDEHHGGTWNHEEQKSGGDDAQYGGGEFVAEGARGRQHGAHARGSEQQPSAEQHQAEVDQVGRHQREDDRDRGAESAVQHVAAGDHDI